MGQARKPLSYDQIFRGGEPRLTRQLPSVTGWADGRRYLETKKKEGDEHAKVYAVDAGTGKDTVYRDLNRFRETLGPGIDAASPASATEDYSRLIYARDRDLFFLDAATGAVKRLTETTAEEHNPTISPARTSRFTPRTAFSVPTESRKLSHCSAVAVAAAIVTGGGEKSIAASAEKRR